MRHTLLFSLIVLICRPAICQTAPAPVRAGQPGVEGKPDLQWFKDAKFGIFIHWGLYSELGGVWNGKRYYGSGEWLMYQAGTSAGEYAGVAATFNPVKFNAAQWVA